MKNFLLYALFLGCISSAVYSQTSPTEKPSSPSKGSISGRVMGDDGQPISGAAVMIFEQGGGNLTTLTTDDEGVFRADGLTAKAYSIQARNSVLVEPVIPSDQKQFYRIGSNVTLNLIRGGVITGRVTDESGKPIVAMNVQAVRVKDEQGKKVISSNENMMMPRKSDDRGIYRLYGLLPGKYIVQTAGNSFGFAMGQANALSENAPVYFPGVTRQAASEVSVAAGDEVTGIDIRFRVETGHSIRIKIIGGELDQNSSGGGMMIMNSNSVMLEHFPGGANAANDFSNPSEGANDVVLRSVADGEYIAYAMRGNFWGESDQAGYLSQRRRLTVKGADLNGITLTLAPLGSIAGKFEAEPLPENDRPKTCASASALRLSEQLFQVRRAGIPADQIPAWANQTGAPNEKGEFKLRRLEAGNYRLTPNLSEENYFLKSINFPIAAKTATAPLDPNKTGLQLKAGENLKDVIVKLAEGAASVSGRVTTTFKLRIHLIPAEKDAGDDVLRYAEVATNSGGTFRFSHVAPGSYWLLAKPLDPQISEEIPASQIAWDAAQRIKFRREAELNNQKIDLMLCQQLRDIEVKWNVVK